MQLELRHVDLLLALIEAGSISGGARLVGLPQPSVSNQLRRIESMLGCTLFERNLYGVQLTDAGRSLAPHLQVINAEAQFISKFGVDRRSKDTLNVCFSNVDLVDRLVESPVAARLDVTIGEDRQAIAGLCNGEFDLVEVTGRSDDRMGLPGFVGSEQLARVPTGVLTSRHSSLVVDGSTTVASLNEQDWIGPPSGSREADDMLAACAALGVLPRIRYRVASYSSFLEIMSRRSALAWGTSSDAARVGGRLFECASPSAGWQAVAYWNQATCERSLRSVLIDWCRRTYAEMAGETVIRSFRFR